LLRKSKFNFVRENLKMEVFEAYKGMYDFKHLPAYAKFILDNHIDDYAAEQIRLSRVLQLPVLASLQKRFSDEEMFNIASKTSSEYLGFIASRNGKEQIMTSMNRWMRDQMIIVGQSEIGAKDITMLNYIRGQALKKFLLGFTQDVEKVSCINAEIDLLLLGASTTSSEYFIEVLRNKIAEQSKLASKLIEASPAITFLFDTVNNRQVFVSGKVLSVMGYTPEELVEMGSSFLLQLIHPRDLENLIEHMQSILKENSNETTQVEFRFKHKDGTYRWLRTYEVIFSRDEHGKPEYILGKTFEITKEKETAIALQKRESELLEAQSLAHIGNYEWNIREQRSTSSEEVMRIFDLKEHQPYDVFIDHIHPEDVDKVRDAIAQSFITGRYECEYRYLKDDKEKVIWSIGRVEFRNEEPYRMVGTVQDITEIKRIERQLIQKSAELAKSNESLRQFAFVASHDMKEPLRKIIMFSDLVLSNEVDKLSPKSVGYLQKMQTAGKNLYLLVEDILAYSLLEVKDEKKLVSLESILVQVLEMLEETIREKNAVITYDHLPGANVVASQFRQLFQNLLTNSLKFHRNDVPPEIRMSAKFTFEPSLKVPVQSSRYLELNITDNGIGFPQAMSEKIFELFSRLHSKAEYEGTGLGLSISRRIVENHDGAITASSDNEYGATFTIVIPQ
jgi:PAS domain S-box-containing protein